MRSKAFRLLPLLVLLGATPLPENFRGKYVVDLVQWRSEAIHEPAVVTINGTSVPLDAHQRDEMLDAMKNWLASATLDVRPDGTYRIDTPLFELDGKWAIADGRLTGSLVTSHLKLDGPLTFTPNTEPFSIWKDGTALRFSADPTGKQSLPIKRLVTTNRL